MGESSSPAAASPRPTALAEAFLAGSQDAIIGISLQGRVTAWNAAAERLLGYPGAEALGMDAQRLLAPERRGLVAHLLGEVQRERQLKPATLSLRRRDGRPVDVEIVVSPLRSGEVVTGLALSARDLTARREALAQLEEQRQDILRADGRELAALSRLRVTLDAVGAGLWELDVASRTVTWDERTRAQFGLPPGEPTPPFEAWLQMVAPEDRMQIVGLHDLLQQQEGQDTFDLTYRATGADGRLRWMHTVGRVDRDADHRPIRAIGVNFDVTAEVGARLGVQHLASVVQATSDAVLALSTAGAVAHANPAADRLFGVDFREMLGHPVAEFLAEDCHADWQQRLAALVAGGSACTFETRVARRDGAQVDAECTLALIRDESGAACRVSAILRDVTARKAVESKLRENQQRLAQIVENIEEVFWISDAKVGCTKYVSPAYEKVWGRSIASVLAEPRSFVQGIHPDDRARIAASLEVHRGGPFEHGYRVVRPDGSTREVIDRGFPVHADDGHVSHYVGVAIDVTERRRAERQAQEAGQRLALAADIAGLGVWSVDPATRALECDDRMARMYGLERPQLSSVSAWLSRVHREDRRAAAAALRRVMTLPHSLKTIFRIRRSDDSIRVIEAMGFVRRDADGRPLQLVGVNRDVTQELARAQSLDRVNQTLNVLSAATNALVHAQAEDAVYGAVVQAIVSQAGQACAWIGLSDTDRPGQLRLAAAAGPGRAGGVAVWPTGAIEGAVERCLRTGLPQATEDLLEDEGRRAVAAALGLRASLVLPLRAEQGVYGVLEILHQKPSAFGVEEVGLLEGLAADISFCVRSLRLRDANQRALEQLERSMEGTVHVLASTVELRDPYTAGHQSRVAMLAVAIARKLGFSGHPLRGIELAATIHDIGKLCVPAEILSKPGRLTPVEYALIQTHAQAGADLLRDIQFPWPIQQMVWQHHERIDGSGYPRGLKGSEIIREAQIIGVADLVEAMASHRPYRTARGLPAALAELARQRGTLFDPEVVDACMTVFKDGFTFTGEKAAA